MKKGRMLPYEAEHLQPVHVGHIQVEHHERRRTEGQLSDRLESARGFGESAVADIAQGHHHHPAHRRGVVDDEGTFHGPCGVLYSRRSGAPGCAVRHAAWRWTNG